MYKQRKTFIFRYIKLNATNYIIFPRSHICVSLHIKGHHNIGCLPPHPPHSLVSVVFVHFCFAICTAVWFGLLLWVKEMVLCFNQKALRLVVVLKSWGSELHSMNLPPLKIAVLLYELHSQPIISIPREMNVILCLKLLSGLFLLVHCSADTSNFVVPLILCKQFLIDYFSLGQK